MWPFRNRTQALNAYAYTFKPRWKEELVCCHADGKFILVLAMGVSTACLPTEARWKLIAPEWAKDHWNELHDGLDSWCKSNRTALAIDPFAEIIPYYDQ